MLTKATQRPELPLPLAINEQLRRAHTRLTPAEQRELRECQRLHELYRRKESFNETRRLSCS